MSEQRIVFFEEIGRNKEDWNCYPCNLNGVMRAADVALLNSHGVAITALCAHHAECCSIDHEKQEARHV